MIVYVHKLKSVFRNSSAITKILNKMQWNVIFFILHFLYEKEEMRWKKRQGYGIIGGAWKRLRS